MEDLKCHDHSCAMFRELARTEPPFGYMECTRILSHMLKDKRKDKVNLSEYWSNFLMESIHEIKEAMASGNQLKSLKSKTHKEPWGNTAQPREPGDRVNPKGGYIPVWPLAPNLNPTDAWAGYRNRPFEKRDPAQQGPPQGEVQRGLR